MGTYCHALTLLAASRHPSFESLGYSAEEWSREADLRAQHLPQEATLGESTVYGQKYAIRATLVGCANRAAAVMSV